VNEAFLKENVYPSLQNCPTKSKEWFAIPGKTSAMDAALLNYGMSNVAVWYDSIVATLGIHTVSGF
jgi:hypothetical protein